MAPMGWLLQFVSHRPTVITVHGLEVTKEGGFYRKLIFPSMRRQTQIIAISEETKRAVDNAFPGKEVAIIHNGLRDVFYSAKPREHNLAIVARETGIDISTLEQSCILYTNGRLIKRKGVEWFVSSVMPKLVSDTTHHILYLVSGTGIDQVVIEAAIREHDLQGQVKLLGRVSDELRDVLYNVADVFIMPNIPVSNDLEGFGLVALEAASCGTTVIASDLEGISDAIHDHKNGLLIKPLSTAAYYKVITETLSKPLLKPEEIRQYTLSNYSWDTAATAYVVAMQKLSNSVRQDNLS
jgi:glycosyltransferase involved in cell wall biosynthesis